MEDQAVEPADTSLLFAVKYLIREYRNSKASFQFLLDEPRFVCRSQMITQLPWEFRPHSLLAPHRQFCEAVRAAIATIESLVESMEAWAENIERTLRDAVSD